MGVPHIALLSTDTETTFGVDEGGGYTWLDQRCPEGSIAPDFKDNYIPDTSVVQSLHQHNLPRIGSQFGASFPFDVYLEGLPAGLATGEAYAHPQNNCIEILRAAMGGVYGASGSSVLGGGATTSSIPVQVGHGVRFSKGGACIIGGEVTPIEDVTVDTLTLKRNLSGAPVNTTDVYNCVTLFLDPSTFGTDTYSLACRLLGELAGDQWIARGCVPTFGVAGSFDDLLVAKVNMRVSSWDKTSGLTLATASYVGAGGHPINGGRIYYGDVGNATRAIRDFDAWTIDPGLQLTPLRALNGIETVTRYRQLRQQATLTLRTPAYVEQDEYYDDADALQEKYCLIQFGTAPMVAGVGTGIIAFEFPTCHISATPKRDASGELIHTEVVMKARLDSDVATPTTAIHTSPIKVHIG